MFIKRIKIAKEEDNTRSVSKSIEKRHKKEIQ